MMSQQVVLRNGSVFYETIVTETMAKLKQLHSEEPANFKALVEHCKHHPNDYPLRQEPKESNPRHLSEFPDCLYRNNLLDHERKVSQAVRNILLSAVEERRGELQLRNPIYRKLLSMEDCSSDAWQWRQLTLIVATVLVFFGAQYFK